MYSLRGYDVTSDVPKSFSLFLPTFLTRFLASLLGFSVILVKR